MKIYLYILTAILLLLGCSKEHDKNSPTVKSGTVELAKVNSHIITNRVLGKRADDFFNLSKAQKKQLIDKLVKDELLIQYALSKNGENNITDENKRAKRGLEIIQELSLKNIKDSLSDANLSKVYEKNKKLYYHEKLFEASDILVDTKQEAEDIIEKLKKADDFNSAFQKTAIAKSKGKSAKAGGYLGFFEEKIMEKPFMDALKTLKKGEWYQKPVKTREGWHVIRLHQVLEKGYYPFKLVKKQIKSDIEDYEISKWSAQKLQELKKDANITYLYDIDKEK